MRPLPFLSFRYFTKATNFPSVKKELPKTTPTTKEKKSSNPFLEDLEDIVDHDLDFIDGDENDEMDDDDMYENYNFPSPSSQGKSSVQNIDEIKLKVDRRSRNYGDAVVNEKIPASKFQLINAEGKNMGIVSKEAAIQQATSQEVSFSHLKIMNLSWM